MIFCPTSPLILPLPLPRPTHLRLGPPPLPFLVPLWLIPLLPRLSSLWWLMFPCLLLALAPMLLNPRGETDGYKQYAGSWNYCSAMRFQCGYKVFLLQQNLTLSTWKLTGWLSLLIFISLRVTFFPPPRKQTTQIRVAHWHTILAHYALEPYGLTMHCFYDTIACSCINYISSILKSMILINICFVMQTTKLKGSGFSQLGRSPSTLYLWFLLSEAEDTLLIVLYVISGILI